MRLQVRTGPSTQHEKSCTEGHIESLKTGLKNANATLVMQATPFVKLRDRMGDSRVTDRYHTEGALTECRQAKVSLESTIFVMLCLEAAVTGAQIQTREDTFSKKRR